MLVTFKTPAHANITMFGDIAKDLLVMMGQSGNVPGALLAEDVAPALLGLQKEIVAADSDDTQPPPEPDQSNTPAPVAISVRAKPLIDLLESALADNESVMWESN